MKALHARLPSQCLSEISMIVLGAGNGSVCKLRITLLYTSHVCYVVESSLTCGMQIRVLTVSIYSRGNEVTGLCHVTGCQYIACFFVQSVDVE